MGSFLERAKTWGQGQRHHKGMLCAMARIPEYGKCLSEQRRGDAENRKEEKRDTTGFCTDRRMGSWGLPEWKHLLNAEGRWERWVKVVEWKEKGSNGGRMEGGKDEGGRQVSIFSQKEEDSMSVRSDV